MHRVAHQECLPLSDATEDRGLAHAQVTDLREVDLPGNQPVSERGFLHQPQLVASADLWDHSVDDEADRCVKKRTFVVTWYVNPRTFPIGSRSRKVEITNLSSERQFVDACRSVWSDVVTDDVLRWHDVQTPNGFGFSQQHIILSQESRADSQVALFRYAGFPILEQVRALIFPDHSLATDVLRMLSILRVCEAVEVKCSLTGVGDLQHIQFETWDRVHIDAPILIDIKALFMEPDELSDHPDTDNATVSDGGSTTASVETDLQDLDSQEADTFSLMEDISPTLRFQPVIPNVPALWLEYQGENAQNDADDVEMEEDVIVINFDDVASDLRAMTETSNGQPFLVASFGLGLVSLGRRDFEMRTADVAELIDRVHWIWSDHAAFARLHVITVNPQPQLNEARPHLVVIVEVAYVDLQDPLRGAPILIQETGSSDIVANPHVYAARIERNSCTDTILVATGRAAQVVPLGAREVRITLGGRIMGQNVWRLIEDGELCVIHFDPYPPHVAMAESLSDRAVPMFVDLRNVFDFHDLVRIEICCHGISPQNRPLGSRSLWIHYGQMIDGSWYDTAKRLWPFHIDASQLVYVARDEPQVQEDESAICTFHFIVNYRDAEDEIPILIRQTLLAHNDESTHSETWAVNARSDTPPQLLNQHLTQQIFWTRMPRRPHIRRYVATDWLLEGELIELMIYTHTRSHILAILTEYVTHETDLEDEQVSYLQRPQDLADSQDSSVSFLQIASLKQQQTLAFKETCETILYEDHEAFDTGEADAHASASQVANQLSSCVNPEVHDLDIAPSTQSHRPELTSLQDALDTLYDTNWIGLNTDFSHIDDLHPFAQKALEATPVPHGQHGTFHVFTDGTAKQGTAAWSFVVLAEQNFQGRRTYFRVGYAGALLQDDIGEFEATSMDAESTAIIAAAEYLMSRSFPVGIFVELHLHFDCTAAGFGSCGLQKPAKQWYGVGSRQRDARIMISLIQRRLGLEMHHIHAHQGHPWNECADSIATWIRNGGVCAIEPQLRSGRLLSHAYKDWAWMQVRPTDEMPGIDHILTQIEVTPVQSQADASFRKQGGAKPATALSGLKIATVNVVTFEYGKDTSGLPTSMRVKEMIKQFQDAHCDVVAIQESRARHDQTWKEGPYIRFISSGLQGHAGVELWFHEYLLSEKLGTGITEQDFTVWYNDHRLLALHFDMDSVGVDIFCCYAPQSGKPDQEIRDWWNHLDKIASERIWQSPIWLLGDLNCKIGAVSSEHIGDLMPDAEDTGGECFRQFCHKFDLFVPSTFANLHEGESTTYVSPLGYESRIDFIALSTDFTHGFSRSFVDTSIDVLNGDRDHHVVAVELQFKIQKHNTFTFKRQPWYDRPKAKLDQQALKETVECIPSIDWATDTTEHWDHIRDHLQFRLAQKFPCQKRQRRQLYFSPHTWELVCQRRDVRNHSRSLLRSKKLLILQAFFASWKSREGAASQTFQYDLHVLHLQLAVTYEQRKALDQRCAALKNHDWK